MALTTGLWRQQIQTIAKHSWRSAMSINLFKSSLRQHPSDIKQQFWTSRIYILCLSLGVAILTFYTVLSVQQKSIDMKNPTLKTALHLQLQGEYNASLQCQCTQINIPYGGLIQLQPIYHQLCSSFVVSDFWAYHVRALLQFYPEIPLHRLDFRHTYQTFYLLWRLCTLINETVATSIQTFDQTQLVTSYLLSADLFENQMFAIIRKFQTELVKSLLRFFQLTRNITYVNQYFSTANIGPLEIIYPRTTSFSIHSYSGENGNTSYTCSCANDITCKSQLGLYNTQYISTPKSLVAGLYRACFALESLLQSTLECFYDDQDCLTNVLNFYNDSDIPNDIIRLNSSLNSRFKTNSTIGSLFAAFFIEYWNQSLNYSSYFSLCRPATCNYKIFRSNSPLETATLVLGLVGGLSVSLRLLIPFIVSIVLGLTQSRQQQNMGSAACK